MIPLRVVKTSLQSDTNGQRRFPMEKLFGQLLMETGIISNRDLVKALDIQRLTGQKLGEILINMKIITPEELELVLTFQKKRE